MSKHSKQLIMLACLIIFGLCIYFSVFFGHTILNLTDLINYISGKSTDNTFILEYLRLPRCFNAIVAGSCLALAGLFMQTTTKNPLAEPYITGVSSGAGLALIMVILYDISPAYYPLASFMGAMLSSLIVLGFAGLNKFSMVKLILTGLSINIFTSSLISLLMLTNVDKTHSMMMILAGNLTNKLNIFKPLLIMFGICLILCIYIIPKLNFLRLDNNMVSALSQNTNKYNIFIVVLSSILASVSVCAAGILGFIGIIVPHISRLLFGFDFRWLFFANILIGSSLILFSDYLARTITYPMELPLGLILSIIGAPIFVMCIIVRGKQLV